MSLTLLRSSVNYGGWLWRALCRVFARSEDATFECDFSWMITRDVRSVRSESVKMQLSNVTSREWLHGTYAVYGLRAVEPVAFGSKSLQFTWCVGTIWHVTLLCGASKSMHFLNRLDGLGLTYRSVLANLFCRDARGCFFGYEENTKLWTVMEGWLWRALCRVFLRSEHASCECDLSWMITRDVRSVRSESCGTSCFWKQKLAVYLLGLCWRGPRDYQCDYLFL